MADRFSLLSLNTWKCEGEYPKRIEAISHLLQNLGPDIVLFQENYSTDDQHSTARQVADSVEGYQLIESIARCKPRRCNGEEGESCSGLAVLSRFPVTLLDELNLPSDQADGQRIAQFIDLDLGLIKCLLINAHLTHLAGEDELRRVQAETITNHAFHLGYHDNVILGGDFNAMPDSPCIKWLEGTGRFTNGWSRRQPDSRYSTLVDSEADDEAGCVDYLFFRAEQTLVMDQCTVVMAEAPALPLPSDHFAVTAEFALTGD